VLTGSPGYIAPERFSTGKVGVQADLFGLGATLYFALEGRGPFDHADPITGLFTSATQPHPPAPHAGPLAHLLDRLLDKNPKTRATVAEARAMIQSYVTTAALRAPTGDSPQVVASAEPTDRPAPAKAAGRAAARVPAGKPARRRRHADPAALLARTRLAPTAERRDGDPEHLGALPTTDLVGPARPRRLARALAVTAGAVVLALAITGVALARHAAATARPAAAPTPSASVPPAIACQPGTLRGDGTSVQSSAIRRWAQNYNFACKSSMVSYPQTMGAGEAVVSPLNDFAGLDAPMDVGQQAGANAKCGPGNHAIHLPMFLNPVAIVYNLGGLVPTGLQLRPATLSGIFAGTILDWDDRQIVNDNPTARLPHTRIGAVHRTDSSVTTQVFTTYLSAASPVWNHGLGVAWPAPGGIGVTGSDGVADYVARTRARSATSTGSSARTRTWTRPSCSTRPPNSAR